MDSFISLEGKSILITGAASGIGLSVAKLFAKYDGEIAIVDISDKGEEVAEQLRKDGHKAQFFKCDLCDSKQIADTVETVVKAFGKIDILVNNAGINVRKNAVDLEEKQWDLMMNIGLRAPYVFCKHVIPHMIAQGGGNIINTASGAAYKACPDAVGYNVLKAGVASLTRSIAVDYGGDHIRCNCVCPGDIDTPMLRSEGLQTGAITTVDPKTPEEIEAMEKYLESCGSWRPLRRIGTVEEIAYAFLFLATDMSRWATGSSVTVDGGRGA